MKVVLAADHGGFELKEQLKKFLENFEYEIEDAGNTEYDKNDDYPDFAIKAAAKVSAMEADRAIIVCGSGVGANIAANKIKGVRASVCHDTYSAHQGVEHDDMNTLCIGGRIIGIEPAKEIVHAFLKAEFTGEERHARRRDKVLALEK